MIISGFGAQGGDISYKIVVGGGALLVIPMLQQRVFLSLEVMTVEVPADAPVISSDGVAIYIAGTVQFRVGGDNLSIAMAAESLLRKSEEEIRNVVYNLMRNQMTATIQKSTASEVRQNSSAFITAMSEGVREQLGKLGFMHFLSSFEFDFPKSFGAVPFPKD